jgi:hypothetical protein
MNIPEHFGFNCPSDFSKEVFIKHFPIRSNVRLSSSIADILNFITEQKT